MAAGADSSMRMDPEDDLPDTVQDAISLRRQIKNSFDPRHEIAKAFAAFQKALEDFKKKQAEASQHDADASEHDAASKPEVDASEQKAAATCVNWWNVTCQVCGEGGQHPVGVAVARDIIKTYVEAGPKLKLDPELEVRIRGIVAWDKEQKAMQPKQVAGITTAIGDVFAIDYGPSLPLDTDVSFTPGSFFNLEVPWSTERVKKIPMFVRDEVLIAVEALNKHVSKEWPDDANRRFAMTGPPGVGKSSAVAAWCIQQASKGKTILLATRTAGDGPLALLRLTLDAGKVCHSRISVDGKWTVDPMQLPKVLSALHRPEQGFHIIVADGVVGESATKCWEFFGGVTGTPTILCTSRQFAIHTTGSGVEEHTFCSWRLEDYEAAAANDEFRLRQSTEGPFASDLAVVVQKKAAKSTSTKRATIPAATACVAGSTPTAAATDTADVVMRDVHTTTTTGGDGGTKTQAEIHKEELFLKVLRKKYCYAGGSARLMFVYTQAEVEKALQQLPSRILFPDSSDASKNAANTAMQRLRVYDTQGRATKLIHPAMILSKHLALEFLRNNMGSIVNNLVFMRCANPSVLGFVFESQCICEILVKKTMLLENATRADLRDTDRDVLAEVQLDVSGQLDFPPIGTGLNLGGLAKKGHLLVPVAWNNPCFDYALLTDEDASTPLLELSSPQEEQEKQKEAVAKAALVADQKEKMKLQQQQREDAAKRAKRRSDRSQKKQCIRQVGTEKGDVTAATAGLGGGSDSGVGGGGGGGGRDKCTFYSMQATIAKTHKAKIVKGVVPAIISLHPQIKIDRIVHVFVVPQENLATFRIEGTAPLFVQVNLGDEMTQIPVHYFVCMKPWRSEPLRL